MYIPEEINKKLIGLPCSRIDIGSWKSLSVGLGDRYKNNNKNSRVEYYGEWELGTYNASWRFIKNKEIIFGSNNFIENNNAALSLSTLNLRPLLDEKLMTIKVLSEFDIRFEFSGNMIIDILNCFNDDDEVLHFLHIEGSFWTLLKNNQWENGKSPVLGKKEKYKEGTS